jgi:hypothetical protein
LDRRTNRWPHAASGADVVETVTWRARTIAESLRIGSSAVVRLSGPNGVGFPAVTIGRAEYAGPAQSVNPHAIVARIDHVKGPASSSAPAGNETTTRKVMSQSVAVEQSRGIVARGVRPELSGADAEAEIRETTSPVSSRTYAIRLSGAPAPAGAAADPDGAPGLRGVEAGLGRARSTFKVTALARIASGKPAAGM